MQSNIDKSVFTRNGRALWVVKCAGLFCVFKKVFSKKTVKPITEFDAKHQKRGGFRENTILISIVLRR